MQQAKMHLVLDAQRPTFPEPKSAWVPEFDQGDQGLLIFDPRHCKLAGQIKKCKKLRAAVDKMSEVFDQKHVQN